MNKTCDVKKAGTEKLYLGASQIGSWIKQGGFALPNYDEIMKQGTQLDIYLTKAQTQQVLKVLDLYQAYVGLYLSKVNFN